MPIYMDIHVIPGVKAKDVAEAHRRDLLHQGEYGCKCMTYWIDEERENVFCLIDAPSKETVEELHGRAHGMVPNRIIEVSENLVESFLGRIYDPEEAETSSDGLKVFHDPSFRVLLVTKTADPILLEYELGAEKAAALLERQHSAVRLKRAEYGGREVEHAGQGFILSFSSAVKALSCALAILGELSADEARALDFRIGMHAGEPVEKSNELFGDALQMADRLCSIAGSLQVVVSSAVRELVSRENFQHRQNLVVTLSPADEDYLGLLVGKLEENWQDPDFNVDEFCQAVAMSKSQLYRKTIELFDRSPNTLLKDYRLEKARELMKKRRYTISQITFDSGFTSPSYFTKCFKKKFGLLPMEYVEKLRDLTA